MRKNLPIEVKFSRRVVEDADPYGVVFYFFATTVPSFFQMLRSGTMPRTQEVG